MKYIPRIILAMVLGYLFAACGWEALTDPSIVRKVIYISMAAACIGINASMAAFWRIKDDKK